MALLLCLGDKVWPIGFKGLCVPLSTMSGFEVLYRCEFGWSKAALDYDTLLNFFARPKEPEKIVGSAFIRELF